MQPISHIPDKRVQSAHHFLEKQLEPRDIANTLLEAQFRKNHYTIGSTAILSENCFFKIWLMVEREQYFAGSCHKSIHSLCWSWLPTSDTSEHYRWLCVRTCKLVCEVFISMWTTCPASFTTAVNLIDYVLTCTQNNSVNVRCLLCGTLAIPRCYRIISSFFI